MKVLCILFVMCILGCTKEYIQHPTCRRYKEVRDFAFPDSTDYLQTDTLKPNNPLSQIVCDSILNVMIMETDTAYWHGCITGGWERYRYLIQ